LRSDTRQSLLPAHYYDGHVSGSTYDGCTFTTFSKRLVCRVVPTVRSAIRLSANNVGCKVEKYVLKVRISFEQSCKPEGLLVLADVYGLSD